MSLGFQVARPYVPSSAVSRPLVGQLRALGNGFGDDTGPRQVRFCSWFPALRIWRDDRASAEATLDLIAAAGWQGIRIFTAVGSQPFWHGREVEPTWPDYPTVVQTFFEACRARGLRLHLTAGDLQVMLPSMADKIDHARCLAHIAQSVGPEVIGLYEACNEGWQNGVETPAEARELCAAFHELCQAPLIATSAPPSEEGADQLAWSDLMPMLVIHGAREREQAARHAFAQIYWDGDVRPWGKPVWQGEPVGPNGAYPDCQPPENDPAYVLAVYAAQQLTGQGSVFFHGPAARYFEPLSATYGFTELPQVLGAAIPDDIAQWPGLTHGNHASAPIGAVSFYGDDTPGAVSDRGPARVDMAYSDTQIVCVVHGGAGPWDLIVRRPLGSWRIFDPYGVWAEGSGPLPAMDASMGCRLITGRFA